MAGQPSTDLFEDHRAIVTLAEDLLALARRQPAPGAEELSQARAQLGARAAQHLRDEDSMIVRPLFASGRAADLPGAMETIAAIREARAHYSNHIGKWTLAAIQADLPGYAEALVGMIDYLKVTLDQEERDLYWPVLRLLQQPGAAPKSTGDSLGA